MIPPKSAVSYGAVPESSAGISSTSKGASETAYKIGSSGTSSSIDFSATTSPVWLSNNNY